MKKTYIKTDLSFIRKRCFGKIIVLFLLSISVLPTSNIGVNGIEEEDPPIMNLYATSGFDLTPFEVNSSIIEFTRDDDVWGNLPMRPFQIYNLGQWYLQGDDGNEYRGEIEGPTLIWITLSCSETITMDLLGTFNINYNPALETQTLNDITIGPEPKTYSLEFDTSGISLEGMSSISMKWDMVKGHDDIQIHLGTQYGTGMTTYIEPMFVEDCSFYKHQGLIISMKNRFYEYDHEENSNWNFEFRTAIDDGPMVYTEHYYHFTGGEGTYYIAPGYYDEEPLGEHTFRWEADYGSSSHSSGLFKFTLENKETPIDDDIKDDTPGSPSDDDGEDPGIDSKTSDPINGENTKNYTYNDTTKNNNNKNTILIIIAIGAITLIGGIALVIFLFNTNKK